jgi:hypothetical protein
MDQTKPWSSVAGEEDVVRCYAPDGTVWATIPLEQPGVREVSPDTVEDIAAN